MERIKERNRRKAALSDRKSAAAQARMKNIASLAADERVGKKRRKGGGGAYGCCDTFQTPPFTTCDTEDMFGADDDDWAIYRKIVRVILYINVSPAKVVLQQNNGDASSDEEDDLTQLQTVENKLLTHDPNFGIEQTHAALSSQRSAFLSAFRPQYIDGDVEGMLAPSILDAPAI